MAKQTKAYTLIELLVVVTIGTIIFTVGFAGYREFSRRQALSGILRQTKADLRLAQQSALTGQKPIAATCTILNGYTFNQLNSTTYQLIANCSNADSVVKTVTMPDNTTISAGSVQFKVLGQGTNLTSPLTFSIANTKSGTAGTVVVGIGGDVQ